MQRASQQERRLVTVSVVLPNLRSVSILKIPISEFKRSSRRFHVCENSQSCDRPKSGRPTPQSRLHAMRGHVLSTHIVPGSYKPGLRAYTVLYYLRHTKDHQSRHNVRSQAYVAACTDGTYNTHSPAMSISRHATHKRSFSIGKLNENFTFFDKSPIKHAFASTVRPSPLFAPTKPHSPCHIKTLSARFCTNGIYVEKLGIKQFSPSHP